MTGLVSAGRPGSHASARRAVAWYEHALAKSPSPTAVPHDLVRHSRVCLRRRDGVHTACLFLCRGCNRMVPWEEGGTGTETAADYACAACANTILSGAVT